MSVVLRTPAQSRREWNYRSLLDLKLVPRFPGSNHIDIINQPRPEERAPKSGLPDFGISMVPKSATADFDARVSKDGHRRDRAGGDPSRRRASHGSSG
jgi:hypothetical protein